MGNDSALNILIFPLNTLLW